MKAPLIAAVAALSILTGGCVSKLAEGRVRSALVDAGLSRPTAACMAERMTDRLSISQLRRLEALRAPISPEIRDVFGRMLATDEEIKAKREALALQPAITDPAALGMTGPEFEAYSALAQGARDKRKGQHMPLRPLQWLLRQR
jgi:hypothetical protein